MTHGHTHTPHAHARTHTHPHIYTLYHTHTLSVTRSTYTLTRTHTPSASVITPCAAACLPQPSPHSPQLGLSLSQETYSPLPQALGVTSVCWHAQPVPEEGQFDWIQESSVPGRGGVWGVWAGGAARRAQRPRPSDPQLRGGDNALQQERLPHRCQQSADTRGAGEGGEHPQGPRRAAAPGPGARSVTDRTWAPAEQDADGVR